EAVCVLLFFFFSSRRRHTRFSRDWSSDVCSSDLRPASAGYQTRAGAVALGSLALGCAATALAQPPSIGVAPVTLDGGPYVFDTRSEERRVGKECRARWAADE